MDDGLTIVIPAYNEATNLGSFLPPLLQMCSEQGILLVVVNDGSTDETGQVLAEHSNHEQLRVIANKVNRGYGGALKAGLAMATTKYVLTMDADGQHRREDVRRLLDEIAATDADMVVGRRRRLPSDGRYRQVGKAIIRRVARLLMPVPIHDLNSGMKIYRADLAQRYLHLCPNSMAFSDVITLVFLSQKHLVTELDITVVPRSGGLTKTSTMSAFETVKEIVNIVVLFNPMKVFLPIALLLIVAGVGWGVPIVLRGRGVSIGAMLSVVSGLILFFMALIAEQLSSIRRSFPPEGK